VPATGKTRITIYLDDEVLRRFREEADRCGIGYQTLINDALKADAGLKEKPLTIEAVRQIVRRDGSSVVDAHVRATACLLQRGAAT